MATIPGQNTFHANRARVIIGGIVAGEAINVSANESGGTAPVRVIGRVEAVEHVHNAYDATIQVGKLVWRTGRLAKFNVGNGLVQIPPFDIEAYDEITNEVLFIARTCTIATRGMTISANQPIQSNVTINAIRLEKGVGNQNTVPEPANSATP
jgi:hypothetical protein